MTGKREMTPAPEIVEAMDALGDEGFFTKPLEGQYIPPGVGDWTVKDTGSIIADIREAMRMMREAPIAPAQTYYAGRNERDWLIRQGMDPDHVKLMEPLHIGVDLASGRDMTVITSYDVGIISYSFSPIPAWMARDVFDPAPFDTPTIGERRLPSPAAAQKAIAKRKAQKRARKR